MAAQVRSELDGEVITITLDRPPVHALNFAMYDALIEAFMYAGQRPEGRVVILTAAGERAFCAGVDLFDPLPEAPHGTYMRTIKARNMLSIVYDCPKPTIAAVNGPALGAGLCLAAACDMRIAAEEATFGLPELEVGLLGGGAWLGRLVPQGTLRRMFFTARPIGAAEAYRVGLVEAVVPRQRLLAEARELAGVIAQKHPYSLKLAKQSLNQAESLSVKEGYELEQSYTAVLRTSAEGQAAMAAARLRLKERNP